jgi:hypothetical protein
MVNLSPRWSVSMKQRGKYTVEEHLDKLMIESVLNYLLEIIFPIQYFSLMLMD